MKKLYITMLASAALLTACDMDQLPEGGMLTEDQKNEVVADNAEKIAGDLNALKDKLIQYGIVSTSASTYHFDYGFPSICLMYDQAGQDMVSENDGYNWFSGALTLSDRIPTDTDNELIWKLHYQHIMTANSILTKNDADKFKYEDREISYSIKKYIEYTGEEQSVNVYWNVEEFLSAGTYHIYIFADGNMIGQGDFSMK